MKRNERKVRVDENSVLVSGRSARVASRGIEREGMEPALVERIEHGATIIPAVRNDPEEIEAAMSPMS